MTGSRRPDPNSKAVYSTEPGWVPPADHSDQPAEKPAGAGPAPVARLRLERKGRAGKAVSVIAGLRGAPEQIEGLARELKAACGAGGTVKRGAAGLEIEIQGDHRPRLEERLRNLGYMVKRVGG